MRSAQMQGAFNPVFPKLTKSIAFPAPILALVSLLVSLWVEILIGSLARPRDTRPRAEDHFSRMSGVTKRKESGPERSRNV
jgi:hypothetical protein